MMRTTYNSIKSTHAPLSSFERHLRSMRLRICAGADFGDTFADRRPPVFEGGIPPTPRWGDRFKCLWHIVTGVVSSHEARFWRDYDEYHDLARRYERNISVSHPDTVTFCPWCYHCSFRATDVVYYDDPNFASIK